MEVLCTNWKGKLAAVAKDVPSLCAAVGCRVPSFKVALKQTWGKFGGDELQPPLSRPLLMPRVSPNRLLSISLPPYSEPDGMAMEKVLPGNLWGV